MRALAFCKWIIDVRLQICQHPNNLKRFKFFWQLLSLKKYLNVFDHKHDWRTITRMTIMKQIKTTSHECTFPWLNIVKIAIGLLSHALVLNTYCDYIYIALILFDICFLKYMQFFEQAVCPVLPPSSQASNHSIPTQAKIRISAWRHLVYLWTKYYLPLNLLGIWDGIDKLSSIITKKTTMKTFHDILNSLVQADPARKYK